MATTAAERVFLDTTILCYAYLGQSPFQRLALEGVEKLQTQGAEIHVSRQVLREYVAAMSKPGVLPTSVPMASLIGNVRDFARSFVVLEDRADVTDLWLELLADTATAGRQIHDAYIVATMLAYQVPILLTHNVSDFKRFGSRITIRPLAL